MRTVLFTKLFESRPVEEIGERAAELGFDGIDLLRPWLHCVGVKNGGWSQGEPRIDLAGSACFRLNVLEPVRRGGERWRTS